METIKEELINKIKDLEYAKNAIYAILKDSDCLVDMHGLTYWAGRVEKLRQEIKELI